MSEYTRRHTRRRGGYPGEESEGSGRDIKQPARAANEARRAPALEERGEKGRRTRLAKKAEDVRSEAQIVLVKIKIY